MKKKLATFLIVILISGIFLIVENKSDFKVNRNTRVTPELKLELKTSDELDLYPEEFFYSEDNIPQGAQFNPRRIFIDHQDNIYISASLYWGSNGTNAMLLAKLNSYGTLLWQKIVFEIDGDVPFTEAMISDSNNNLYVAAYAGKHVDKIYLFKYNASGNLEWVQTWDPDASARAVGMAIDAFNNIYVAGTIHNSKVCVIKYDMYGNQLWNATYGGIVSDPGRDIAISELGNIYILASTESFGSGNMDAWFFEIDSNGNMIWNKTFGTPASDFCSEIAVDSSSNIYIQMALNGFFDIFKFNPSGNYLCNSSISKPGSYPDYRYEEMLIQDDYIYSLIEESSIWKFNSTCTRLWRIDNLHMRSMSMDSMGNIYTTGLYEDGYIMKLSSVPYIIIEDPYENQIFAHQAPPFNLTIFEPDIFGVWYSLDYGLTYHSINGSEGVIDQEEWDSLDDGYITISFFVEDTFGNVGREDVLIFKDTEAPDIIVQEPIQNTKYGSTPPNYTISISGFNLIYGDDVASCWYFIEEVGDGEDISIIGIRDNIHGTISSYIWEWVPEGLVNITFGVRDVFGNERYVNITVEKRHPSQPPELPILIIVESSIVVVSVIAITIVILKTRSKKE